MSDSYSYRECSSEILKLLDEIKSLSQPPPQPKASNFDNPGEVVVFSEQDISLEPEIIRERVIMESDLLPINFLEIGVKTQRAVARIVLSDFYTDKEGRLYPPNTGLATGFMVSPNLLLTNHHVVDDLDIDRQIRIEFNYQLDENYYDRAIEHYYPDTNKFFLAKKELDYALIWIKSNPVAHEENRPGEIWGKIQLPRISSSLLEGLALNIIQHPNGQRKAIALQNNQLIQVLDNVIRYQSDTEPGSSGGPVLNNFWQLVGLHQGTPKTPKDYNQGIRIDRIVEDLQTELRGGINQSILEELGL